MDADDLLLLDSIIAEGGVTAAALKLDQPKATVSRRLRRLEKAVGAPLFDRSGRRLRLTRTGEAFAAPALAVRIAVTEARALAAANETGQHGNLRIASPFLFGRLVLVPFISKFLSQNHNVVAALKFDNAALDPLRENFDLTIRVQPPVEPYLMVTKLADAELRLFGTPEIASKIAVPDDLQNIPAINTSNADQPDICWRLTEGRRISEVKSRVRCTVNDPEAACYLTTQGLGVGALPEFLASDFVAAGTLAPILPRMLAGRIGIYAALPPLRTSIPIVRAFLHGLKKQLTDQRFGKLSAEKVVSKQSGKNRLI